MPIFAYRARDALGQRHDGTRSSTDSATLAAELRGAGWLVLDVRPADPRSRDEAREGRDRRRGLLRPASLDLETGFRQLALMHRSGLTLLSSLQGVAENARRGSMSRIWRRLSERVESGVSLTDAMAGHPRQFSPLVRELIRAGEDSGTLELALERSAGHLQRRRELRGTLLRALFYPSLVILLTLAVTIFLVVEVIPELQQFLLGAHQQLPLLTRALLAVSNWMSLHLPTLMLVAGTSVLAILALDRWPPARLVFDQLLFRLPLIGRLRRLTANASFGRSLGTLLSNGVGIVQSLRLVEGILPRPVTARALARARERVLEGSSLADGLAGSPAFTPLLSRMIAVGEQTGELDRVLEDLASHHEGELQLWLQRAGMLIEPIVTIVVGGIVGFVYIAFFLAIFSLAGGG